MAVATGAGTTFIRTRALERNETGPTRRPRTSRAPRIRPHTRLGLLTSHASRIAWPASRRSTTEAGSARVSRSVTHRTIGTATIARTIDTAGLATATNATGMKITRARPAMARPTPRLGRNSEPRRPSPTRIATDS